MICDKTIKEFCDTYRLNFEKLNDACSKKIGHDYVDTSIPTNMGEVIGHLESLLVGLLLIQETYPDGMPASISVSQDHIVMVYRMLKTFHEGKSYTSLGVI